MVRYLPLLLGLIVVATASAQDDPAAEPDVIEGAVLDDSIVPNIPARANDDARQSPNASVSQTIGTTNVLVQYGRPGVRGREIFGTGALVPYNEVWRTGANEATTFTAFDDVMVEGQRLPAGTYALFTVPGEDQWTIIFNRKAEQWGAYEYGEADDALRVQVAPVQIPPQEQFQIQFEDVSDTAAVMHLHWDTVGVPVRISTAG